nr:unnamed protein product [Callosobruchus analis]
MKLTNMEERIHILNGQSNTWSVIKDIVSSNNQEDAFYVCDVGDIIRKHKIWKTVLPRVEPFYAVKCNDSLVVLEVLNALGTSFDCASKAEINKVMGLGVSPDRIIFANPAKPASHLRHAAEMGVELMTFDSDTELHKIKKLFPAARLVIRIRSDAIDVQCQLGNKFGCDADLEAPALLALAAHLGLEVVGVSFHVGSGCREPSAFSRAIRAAKGVFEHAQMLGYNMTLLDIGGGYPGGRTESIERMADEINCALDEYFPDPNIRIIAEPGRFYVGSAYTLTCNIYSIRNVVQTDSDGNIVDTHRMYYINDGVYGSFNCILYDHQVVEPKPLEQAPDAVYRPSSVWGPTCDGLDQVADNVMLPEMKVGDWLVFEDMGAYTLPVASPFNGFPVPKVQLIFDEDVWSFFKDVLNLTEEHFEMLKVPTDLHPKKEMDPGFQLPEFPIKMEIPCRNGNSVKEHILDYVNVAAE